MLLILLVSFYWLISVVSSNQFDKYFLTWTKPVLNCIQFVQIFDQDIITYERKNLHDEF